MALSFFKSVNPFSRSSGITYSFAMKEDEQCIGKEMIDQTICENIRDTFYEIRDGHENPFWCRTAETSYHIFTMIAGTHYDLLGEGEVDCRGGAKGILDLLIVPLIARKLISECFTKEREGAVLKNIISLLIAIPMEIARISIGLALTFIVSFACNLGFLVKDVVDLLTEPHNTEKALSI